MKRGGAKIQSFFKGLFKSFVFLIIFLIGLILLLGLISRSSLVQTFIVQKIVERVNEERDVSISVDRVYLSGLRTLNLENTLIRDHHLDTMIYLKELNAEISLKSIFARNTLYLSDVNLETPYFYLHKTSEDTTYNINYFVEKLSSENPDTTGDPLKIYLNNVYMQSGTFLLHNDTVDIVNGFNTDSIRFEGIYSRMQDLMIHHDTVKSDIDSLLFRDVVGNKNFSMLHTDFQLTSSEMRFYNTDLEFNNSRIRDSLYFGFNSWDVWKDFSNTVDMKFNLDDTKVWTGDINYFTPLWKWEDEKIALSGDFKGKLSSFSFNGFDIRYGWQSFVKGNINVEGLPEIDNTIISLEVRNSSIKSKDIKSFFKPDVYAYAENLKYVNLNGQFYGFYYDFVSDAYFRTALGDIRTDINFKLPEKGPATYSGALNSSRFQLGKLIAREDLVKTVNITAKINGSGLSAAEADLKMDATLNNSILYGHKYNKIAFDARLKENLFDGSLNINDSALNLVINGLINLDPEKEKVDITGEIFNANLDEINLTEKDGFVKGKIDLDFTGLTFDKTSGQGYLSDIEVFYDEKFLELDTLSLLSQLVDSIRNIEINSELLNARLKGNFKLKEVFADFQMIVEEYRLQLINEESEIRDYYSGKVKRQHKYSAEWSVFFSDVNPIMSLFVPELFISPNTSLDGRFSVGNTEIFNLYTHIDTVIYDRYQFFDNEIDISTSKFADSTDILAFIFLNSKKQVIPDVIEGKELKTEILWNNNRINFETAFRQFDDSNFVDLQGRATFRVDSTILVFTKSDFKIFENSWDIVDENRIVFDSRRIKVQNLKITSQFESIDIDGIIARDPEAVLSVDFNDFNLRNFNPLIGRNITGVLNADLDITGIYSQIRTFGNIQANDCTIEGFLVGDISGTSEWSNVKKAIVSDFSINRLGKRVLELEGTIEPRENSTGLNFVANMNQTNMNIIEPFASDLMSDIKGQMTGFLNLTGTTEQPNLQGKVNIEGGGFLVNYLNTYYTFSDQLNFNTDNISARNLVLRDKNGNRAVLNGGIFHDGFTNPVLDLRGQLNNFEVLNTTPNNNNLYYGNAFASGDIEFLGAFSDIQITSDLRSEKGTFIHIPTDTYTELEKGSHITFLSDIEETDEKSLDERFNVDLSGISMNFNLSVTPDARMEIILDRQTGDIIRGRGNGELNLEIDTRGEFKMYGYYEIQEGSYNFTLLNIVNKEFKIEEGGRISWSGDPYQGQLDIVGSYTQNVQLKPLMESADSVFLNSPQATRRSPVSVNLFLTGPLLSPDFEFGIEIKNPPVFSGYDFNNDLLAFKNRIQNNKDYLNRQVFSLIVLRQFSQEESGYQQPAGRNLSELLSNQLSNYVSSVNENLEVNLDLSGLSQEDLNDLQLRLSYTFLEGRLRVTREGGFTNSTNEAEVSTIIGDWTIEYALTEDGKLRAKMFNRNNANVYLPGSRTTNTTGLSVLYTRSFDDFVEFLKSEKKEPKPSKQSGNKNSPAIRDEAENVKMERN